MGCASSKQKRCRHCEERYAPVVARSYSMHVHHPAQSKDDSYHLVALTSTTLGSLKLDSPIAAAFNHCGGGDHDDRADKDSSLGLIEAKTWSTMIDRKIPKITPKTPIRTPPGEPETINAWELMEGLEDVSPFRSPIHVRSFSFDVVRDPIADQALPLDRPKSRFQEEEEEEENSDSPKKPMWLQMADNSTEDYSNSSNSVVTESEFDPEIISSFRKSLEKLENDDAFEYDDSHRKVSKSEKPKLILYFTSLRGVRKTYEDCCHVRVILKSLGVRADERDVSMHSGFKEELKRLAEDKDSGGGGVIFSGGLPRVFVGERCVGGADEIRKLNEDGQLEKLLDCCEKIGDFDGDLNSKSCEACGDIRFVPCDTCSGSCKIYYENEEEEDEENSDSEEDFGFQRCPDCNENGLIRCPICCY